MAVDVPEEVLAGRVFHSIFQPYQVRLLGHHVHGDIGGESLFLVIEPFNGIGVGQGSHPEGDTVVVDLGVVVFNLKLGYQLGHFSQLPASQAGGRILIHHRDLVHTDLSHIGRKISGLHLDQIPVPGGVEKRDANGCGDHHQDNEDSDEAKADLQGPGQGSAGSYLVRFPLLGLKLDLTGERVLADADIGAASQA